MTYTMPRPTLPTGEHVTIVGAQLVWDHYVRPEQEAEVPQSGEMRVLMAVLRAVYAAMGHTPEDATTLDLPAPVVAPFGWEVDTPELVQEVADTFLVTTPPGEETPHHQVLLAAILTAVKDALTGEAPTPAPPVGADIDAAGKELMVQTIAGLDDSPFTRSKRATWAQRWDNGTVTPEQKAEWCERAAAILTAASHAR